MGKHQYLFSILNKVIKDKVYYAINVAKDITFPFIVYQELNKKPLTHVDDKSLHRIITFQITLITKLKNLQLEAKLETTLNKHEIDYSMTSEYLVKDVGIHRVYEIKLEEFK